MDGSLAGVVDVRMSVSARVLLCAECGDEQAFEQPPCADGHDACPEWFCVECGYAIFLDPVAVEVASPVRDAGRREWRRPRGTADSRRHAA